VQSMTCTIRGTKTSEQNMDKNGGRFSLSEKRREVKTEEVGPLTIRKLEIGAGSLREDHGVKGRLFFLSKE